MITSICICTALTLFVAGVLCVLGGGAALFDKDAPGRMTPVLGLFGLLSLALAVAQVVVVVLVN